VLLGNLVISVSSAVMHGLMASDVIYLCNIVLSVETIMFIQCGRSSCRAAPMNHPFSSVAPNASYVLKWIGVSGTSMTDHEREDDGDGSARNNIYLFTIPLAYETNVCILELLVLEHVSH